MVCSLVFFIANSYFSFNFVFPPFKSLFLVLNVFALPIETCLDV